MRNKKNLLKIGGLYIWDRFCILIWPHIPSKIKLSFKNFIDDHKDFDCLLAKLFVGNNWNVIQVGSNDGISNDPLRKYITKNQWNAILIEPVPLIYQKLAENYKEFQRVRTLNIAVSNEGNQLDFYSVSNKAKQELGDRVPDWYDQLGSFIKSNIENHLNGILIPYIEKIEVKVKTLDQIYADSNFNKLNVLHIDAEGYDLEVLKSIQIEKIRPNILIFEHKHLRVLEKISVINHLERIDYKIKIFHDDVVAFLTCD